jgi:hypothetical protein
MDYYFRYCVHLVARSISMESLTYVILFGLLCRFYFMTPLTKRSLAIFFVFVCHALNAQSNFSFGPAFSAGYPTVSGRAYLITPEMKSSPERLRDQLVVANSLTLRYIIGNRFGVESGLQVINYNYIFQSESNTPQKFIGTGATMHLHDFQVPLLFVVQLNHPTNPYRNFKLVGGTSYDFMTTDLLAKWKAMPWLRTVIVGVRLGTNKIKKVTCEYGIEYQYGQRFTLDAVDYKFEGDRVSAQQNFLSFKLLFFIHPKSASKDTEG